MGGQHQPRAVPKRVFNSGKCLADARVVGDVPGLIQRHVEIHPHEDALALQVQVPDGKLGHRSQAFLAMNLMRSRTRQEYPHSLSYQEITFTQLPATTSVS